MLDASMDNAASALPIDGSLRRTVELILAAGTVNADLVARIDAASAAGYSALGLRPEDYEAAVVGGLRNAEIRSRLDASSLKIKELQSVTGWAGDLDERNRARELESGCYLLAEAVGGEYVMASQMSPIAAFDEAIEQFASMCDRAAEHGLKVALEFLPWGPIPDARTAWKLVSMADRANGGVLVDSWHHFRGAHDEAQLREIPADRVFAVQICDARSEVRGSPLEDTRNERLNPGFGDFDLTRFINLLDEMRIDVPYSVEILSDYQRSLPPQKAAEESARATWRTMSLARRGSV